MADPGNNPRYGWDQGPWGYGGGFGYPGNWAAAQNAPFEVPEGFGWYEVPAGGGGAYNPYGLWQNYGGFGDPWGLAGGYCGGGGYGAAYGGGYGGFYGGGYGGGWGGDPYGFGGYGGGGGYMHFGPENNGGRPAMNVRNEFGGIGLPPNTQYFFHDEHCLIIQLDITEPPWRNQHIGPMPTLRHYVPCNTNVKALMKHMGCNNPDDKKNVLYECVQAGDGNWYKGVVVNMDDKDAMKKNLNEMQWTKVRNGVDEDAVYLYFTSE